MKSIQSLASGTFILSVIVLTGVSILGVWNIFNSDVMAKSFETFGILAAVAIIVEIAGSFVRDSEDASASVAISGSVFTTIRHITVGVLIFSSVLIAFLSVLSIWDVITGSEVLARSFSSLTILTFSSMVIVMMALEQEKNDLWKRRKGGIIGVAVLVTIALYLFFAFTSMMY